MNMLMRATGLFLFAASAASAAVLEVGAGKQFTRIQAALDAASSNDVISIYPGTYTELVQVKDHGITLQGVSGTPRIVGRIDAGSYRGVTISGLEVTGWTGGYHGIYQNGGHGLAVLNCVVHDGERISSASGVYARNSSGLRVEGCELYGCRKGVTVIAGRTTGGYEGGSLIRANRIHNNPDDGIDIHGQYLTIDGNEIYDNLDREWVANHPDGIQLIAGTADGQTAAQHVRIRNNVIRNHTQNIFTEGMQPGPGSDCTDIHIYNNVVYNEPVVIDGVNLDTLATANLVIKYSREVYVYHNTLGNSGSKNIYVDDCYDGSVVIKNNILHNRLKIGIYVRDVNDVAAGGLDYNLYFNRDAQVVWGATFYDTRAQFAAAKGLEVHGLDADPMLVSWPAAALPDLSPAVDAGLALPSLYGADRYGSARPRGSGWDIGAVEAAATVRPSPPSNVRVDVP